MALTVDSLRPQLASGPRYGATLADDRQEMPA